MKYVYKCRILVGRLPLSKGQNLKKTIPVISMLVTDLQLHCILILCHSFIKS